MIDSISAEEHRDRVRSLQERMQQDGVQVALVTSPANVYYLSGFRHYVAIRALLVVVPSEGDPVLITPKGEFEMGERTSWIADVRYHVEFPEEGRLEDAHELIRQTVVELAGADVATIGIERSAVTLTAFETLRATFGQQTFHDVSEHLSALRAIKSPAEVALVRAAGHVAIAGWTAALEVARPGVTEYEVAMAALQAATDHGASQYGLPDDQFLSPIVQGTQIMAASGRASMGHARASTRRLELGDLVMMCFCLSNGFKGYHTGFCRHFSLGPPEEEFRVMFDVILQAQRECLDEVRAGTPAARIDDISRARLATAGLDRHLGHRVGRGVGIDIAEAPELKNTSPMTLAPGMTISVEPAVYIPGRIGLEIEDTVVVTEDGYESLTPTDKEIVVL